MACVIKIYDDRGRLAKAGETSYCYDKKGALSERCDSRGISKFFYGADTMLDKAVLPSGVEIRYEYDRANPTGPARRFRNGILVTELGWHDPVRLAFYRNYANMVEYSFGYASSGQLQKIGLKPIKGEPPSARKGMVNAALPSNYFGEMAANERKLRLHAFLSNHASPLELFCGLDQVGTLRTLTFKNGQLAKEIWQDSFGVQYYDSFPDLFIPVGFAGGLADPGTGLVRFGYRDYDPQVGRFTAKDPLGDTGGDHDLWDYCVDDPVSMVDPEGLLQKTVLSWTARLLAKQTGKRLAALFDDKYLNPDEEMVSVRNKINDLESKSSSRKITDGEQIILDEAREREIELFEDYGDMYTKHDKGGFYRRYFPDDDYAWRKLKEVKGR